ncbi:MAG: hypothetical protein NZ804_05410 [Roseibacillus sp.]|nr:hypothetical protein [Roseibacillus sp.]
MRLGLSREHLHLPATFCRIEKPGRRLLSPSQWDQGRCARRTLRTSLEQFFLPGAFATGEDEEQDG